MPENDSDRRCKRKPGQQIPEAIAQESGEQTDAAENPDENRHPPNPATGQARVHRLLPSRVSFAVRDGADDPAGFFRTWSARPDLEPEHGAATPCMTRRVPQLMQRHRMSVM